MQDCKQAIAYFTIKKGNKGKSNHGKCCQGKIESHGTDINNEFCHWKPWTLLYKLQSHHSSRWGIKCASSTRHQGRGSAAWLWIPQVFQEHALTPFIHLCTQEVFRQWLQSRGGSLAPQPHYFTCLPKLPHLLPQTNTSLIPGSQGPRKWSSVFLFFPITQDSSVISPACVPDAKL